MNPFDTQETREARELARAKARQEEKDLAAILEMPEGRRFLAGLMAELGTYSPGCGETFAARRDVGVNLAQRCLSANETEAFNVIRQAIGIAYVRNNN